MYRELLIGDDASVLYNIDHVTYTVDSFDGQQIHQQYYPNVPRNKLEFKNLATLYSVGDTSVGDDKNYRFRKLLQRYAITSTLLISSMLVTRTRQPLILCPRGSRDTRFSVM